ncbi:pentapeptide repeat-containing protein [Haloplanus sp. C73]|uniref:pentapeptide repeat-containing protein n=1 Tax=Haloplanus sp. C73 TaxID=3421641 RepID=UPI003EBD3B60
MSGAQSCAYTHDVSAFDDIEGAEWGCPHDRYGDSDTCIFHQPIRALDSVTPEQVGTALEAVVETADAERHRILGARCPGLDLRHTVVDGGSNHPIDLREAWFLGRVDCENCRIAHALRFDRAVFETLATFEDSIFEANTSFAGVEFRADADFNLVTFRRWANFEATTFRGEARFRASVFRSGIFGIGVTFRDAADFMSAQFEGVANLYDATFDNGGLFASTTFEGDAKFIKSDFRGPVAVGENFVDDPALADTALPYRDGVITDTALVISSSTCVGDLELDDVTTDDRLLVTDTTLDGDIELRGASTATAETVDVALWDVETVSGVLELAPGLHFDFGDSVLEQVDFQGVERIGPNLRRLDFENAVFDGFDFGAYRELFERLEWRIHTDGTTPSERENTYLRAKNGAIDVGENTAAREFHYRELVCRGESHRRRLTEWDRGDDESRLAFARRKSHAARKLCSNLLLRTTCGYGERPGRVVLASIVVILGYAAAYDQVGVDLSYRGWGGALAFSFQSFNALVLGLPEVESATLGVLVASEAFLGPFFVALFVFSITQSLGR